MDSDERARLRVGPERRRVPERAAHVHGAELVRVDVRVHARVRARVACSRSWTPRRRVVPRHGASVLEVTEHRAITCAAPRPRVVVRAGPGAVARRAGVRVNVEVVETRGTTMPSSRSRTTPRALPRSARLAASSSEHALKFARFWMTPLPGPRKATKSPPVRVVECCSVVALTTTETVVLESTA